MLAFLAMVQQLKMWHCVQQAWAHTMPTRSIPNAHNDYLYINIMYKINIDQHDYLYINIMYKINIDQVFILVTV